MQRLIILIVVIGQNMVGSAAAMGSPEEPQNAGAAILGRVRVVPTHNSSASSATTDHEKLGFGVPVTHELAKYFQGSGERCYAPAPGAKMRTCDWATDLRLDGPNVAFPYGRNAHTLVRVSLLRAPGGSSMMIGTAGQRT